MRPVAFNGCFGQLHEARGDTAIVLCGAIGFEHLCAHRGWRELGDRLAAHGYPTLRFDWPGCGDSLGADGDPSRLTAWRHALSDAITFIRGRLSPRRIVLVGLRIGATLAADVAGERGDIDGLVLLAPAISGKLYGRELAALATVMAPLAPERIEGGLVVGGFRLTRETLDAMTTLDLRKQEKRAAPFAAIFAPAAALGVEETARHWRALGCDTDVREFDGAAAWLAEPTLSQTPSAMFDDLIGWLMRRLPPAPAAHSKSIKPARLDGGAFIETAMQFGAEARLFAMLCEPRARSKKGPLAIFLNAGANSHVGWARMHVEAARRLAAAGFASLRMDAAGLGDSPPAPLRKPQPLYDLALCEDVSAAIDAVAARGYTRICVIGLCSGAHTAFHAALRDPRIHGLVLANLQKFVWREDDSLAVAIRHAYRATGAYRRGAFRLDTYRRLLRGDVDARGIARALLRRAGRIAVARLREIERSVRDTGDETSSVRRWFRHLSERGARILLVYSADDGGLDELALHGGAGGRRFRRLRGVELARIGDADHNLTQRAARAQFLALVLPFLRQLDPTPRIVAQGDPERTRRSPPLRGSDAA